jgi:hypothetical protein
MSGVNAFDAGCRQAPLSKRIGDVMTWAAVSRPTTPAPNGYPGPSEFLGPPDVQGGTCVS